MVTTSEITYEALGRRLVGRLALPNGNGPHPGILIAHEGPGLDDLQLRRADELAELGYAAFALDYHGGGAAIEDRDEAIQRLDHLFASPEETRALGQAGLDVLLSQPMVDKMNVAAIGYCFGGAMVLELGRAGADLNAIVGFHPGLRTQQPEDAKNITGSVLVLLGSEDTQITLTERNDFEREMRLGGVDWQMHIYGGAHHCFTHPWVDHLGLDDFRYDEKAANHAWQAMLDLFATVFDRQEAV